MENRHFWRGGKKKVMKGSGAEMWEVNLMKESREYRDQESKLRVERRDGNKAEIH